MKKAKWLLLCSALLFTLSCEKDSDGQESGPSADAELTGETVDVTGLSGIKKIFVLSEGGIGSNNACLDMLRVEDASYVSNVFNKMNPDIRGGLGDVGNDIAVIGNEVWMVINNSGLVQVISARDETAVTDISVPTPRNLAFDDNYVYVTSWSGAYASYGSDGSVSGSNPKGKVCRINRKTKQLEDSVVVGYQPEGIACVNGLLYIANSGGISSQLAPDYSYDNTVSVVSTEPFKLKETIRVEVNLKSVYPDGDGGVYVTNLGNYWDIHSGLYRIDRSGKVSHIADYVSISAEKDGTVYWVGTEDEFVWGDGEKQWKSYSCKGGKVTALNLPVKAAVPYGLCAMDGDTFLLADAVDYFNPGTVSLYRSGSLVWTVSAGVCPGQFAIWK